MYQNISNYKLFEKKFEKLNNEYELCYNKNTPRAKSIAKELLKITNECLDLTDKIRTISDFDRKIYKETIKKILDQYPDLKAKRGVYFVKRSPTRRNPDHADMLIIASRVKAYGKTKGMSIGSEAMLALNAKVKHLIDDAMARAKALNRTQLKTPHI